MKIETIQNYCSYFRRADEYTISCEIEKGKVVELSFCSWKVESDSETDAGVDFDKKSQAIYDSLDEELQIEIDDYIIDLK